jgi:PAS domain S-box-containing protein
MVTDIPEAEEVAIDTPEADDKILVLHVDDQPSFSELVELRLEELDDRLSVVTESDPEAGLERLHAEPVDCVVSDYQMPGIDGLELLDAVREDYPNLPFILFTGHGSESIASEAINAGVTTYLTKNDTEIYDQLANHVGNAVRRHRSERRARVRRDRLLEMYEQTDGFFSLDEDWEITYWNRTMAERTGRAPEDVVGRPYLEVFPEAEGTELHEHYEVAMDESETVEFETRYDPHGYWLQVCAYPVENGLFVHSRDVTEAQERESELRNRNRILESFASTVSHDLRNPLSVAQGNLQLAQETGDFEHLEEVTAAHNRMQNLIDELLRIARGEELEFAEVTLSESAREAYATVSAEGMELVVGTDAEFLAQPTQLRRLLENLFWNALEHGAADAVRVGATDDGFFVADDGAGIEPEDREQVLDAGFTTQEDNPGYGLHIVAGIVELHGWELAVGASADGGARFDLTGVEFVGE